MLFLTMVIVPVMRKPEYQSFSARLFHQTGLKFRTIGWSCLILFLISGIFNLVFRAGGWQPLHTAQFWQGYFGETLLVKLILFAFILILSAIHDFYMGPKATRLWQEDPHSPRAKTLRKGASWFGRINLLLGLIIVYLAVGMVRGWP